MQNTNEDHVDRATYQPTHFTTVSPNGVWKIRARYVPRSGLNYVKAIKSKIRIYARRGRDAKEKNLLTIKLEVFKGVPHLLLGTKASICTGEHHEVRRICSMVMCVTGLFLVCVAVPDSFGGRLTLRLKGRLLGLKEGCCRIVLPYCK